MADPEMQSAPDDKTGSGQGPDAARENAVDPPQVTPGPPKEDFETLKERVLNLLYSGDADAPARESIKSFISQIETKSKIAEQADSIINELAEQLAKITPPRRTDVSEWSVVKILQTPPFYFFFGLVLLGFAFVSSQIPLNSSLTFLVAMLGVAILLYGTGSQAAGTFGSSPGQAQQLLESRASREGTETVQPPPPTGAAAPGTLANIAIAGGAAVLTAFFGWAVIEKSGPIRQVFRDFDTYTRVKVDFCSVAEEGCADPNPNDQNRPTTTGPETQKLNAQLLDQLRAGAHLETGLGYKAYARSVDSGLEFIVFDRDLGNEQQVRLVGASISDSASSYSTDNNWFSLKSGEPCLLQAAGGDGCAYIAAVKDAVDIDRVPRMVIKAVVSPEVRLVTTDDDVTIPGPQAVIPR